MATVSPYSQKVLNCHGHACVKCGYCRDWYWTPHDYVKTYTKRPDATCAASYGYGLVGYGHGCGGCAFCCLAYFLAWLPFGDLCSRGRYFGGGGYAHGAGLPLNGYLNGGVNHHIDKLAGVNFAARDARNENAGLAGLVIGGNLANIIAGVGDETDGTRRARRDLTSAHHDGGRLCECSDNQQ